MHIPTLLLSFAVLSAIFVVHEVDSRAAEPVEFVKDNSSTEAAGTKSTVSTETEADKGDAATNATQERRTEVRSLQENATRLILSDETSADDEQRVSRQNAIRLRRAPRKKKQEEGFLSSMFGWLSPLKCLSNIWNLFFNKGD